jgi:hypothetical protein
MYIVNPVSTLNSRLTSRSRFSSSGCHNHGIGQQLQQVWWCSLRSAVTIVMRLYVLWRHQSYLAHDKQFAQSRTVASSLASWRSLLECRSTFGQTIHHCKFITVRWCKVWDVYTVSRLYMMVNTRSIISYRIIGTHVFLVDRSEFSDISIVITKPYSQPHCSGWYLCRVWNIGVCHPSICTWCSR